MEKHAAASGTQPVRDKSLIDSVIVIGTGLAGLRTTSALRDQGFTGDITILGTEPHLPYDRPPLSKKLLAHSEPVFLHDDLGLILHELTPHAHTGLTVTDLDLGLDSSGQPQVTVTARFSDAAGSNSGGQGSVIKRFTATAVVLAVGSAPIVPSGWAGTHKLYTWEDAQKLRSALTKSEHQDVVIIGAGWIGAELATVAADAGHNVTVVEAQATPLAAQLGTEIGTITASWYSELGINLLSATSVDRVMVNPDSKRKVHVTGADRSGSRSLVADIVITAVGARPATQWLPDSFPRTALGGLQTDQWGRIAVPDFPNAHVYAVGDCAERQDSVFTTVPGGHWNTALQDPDRVAAAITGTYELPRAHAPQVFSTQLGHEVNLFGLPNVLTDHVLIRPSATADGQDWVGLYVSPEESSGSPAPDIRTVTGIFTVDSPRFSSQARKLMSNGPVRLDMTKALDPSVQLRLAAA
ncbi:NAD(P)/FAD-dependent oxidoreductase [Jonesiaceae bacterium BS-20]|uniref:NAD(P)/FAD-dependent oxidoreductase n=1 Tax=Jonesiaceae bacterium BS-20 TaxID=3120821 RepID=A0AAU7DXH0_9MICO